MTDPLDQLRPRSMPDWAVVMLRKFEAIRDLNSDDSDRAMAHLINFNDAKQRGDEPKAMLALEAFLNAPVPAAGYNGSVICVITPKWC